MMNSGLMSWSTSQTIRRYGLLRQARIGQRGNSNPEGRSNLAASVPPRGPQRTPGMYGGLVNEPIPRDRTPSVRLNFSWLAQIRLPSWCSAAFQIALCRKGSPVRRYSVEGCSGFGVKGMLSEALAFCRPLQAMDDCRVCALEHRHLLAQELPRRRLV
jgi:hypothetical protein